jgi:hypothetical protein
VCQNAKGDEKLKIPKIVHFPLPPSLRAHPRGSAGENTKININYLTLRKEY